MKKLPVILKILFLWLTVMCNMFVPVCNCLSQGMINNGATITITTGAVVYIDGDALGKYTNQTNAGSDGKIDINGSMYVEGDWVNNATGNNVFINNTVAPWGTVYLNGAAASDITGSGLTEFENLYIQNANRTLQITNCEVNNNLTVDNSTLILNQRRFIIDNNAAAGLTSIGTGNVRSENTASPFGEIQWNIGSSTGGSYIIPFGTAAPVMIPFTFAPTAGTTGNLVVATYPTNPANLPYPPGVTHVNNLYTGLDNSGMTVDRFWEVIVPGALTTANVNFRCTAAEATGIPNPRAQRWVQPFLSWEFPLQGAQSTQVTGTNVIGMSAHNMWWTLADITSPLPVELLYFKAACDNQEVFLQWSTASEKDCKSFSVEKSRDGNDFVTVTEITGAGNSTSTLFYSTTDRNTFSGISYYRLKQTDYNGIVTIVSDGIAVKNCSEQDAFSVDLTGNPALPSLVINEPSGDNLRISIFDASGKLINSENVAVKKGLSTIKLNTEHLSSSVYLIRIENKNQALNKKMLITK
ncbi:MAG TPA: T9SS type A sorting domain-containing protein [Bacteroidia bacterium]|nr:T9SS type A sorting domain-containing protein [Bacteroidia bacterium]